MSAAPQPDDWLPLDRKVRPVLVLRLYDTAAGAILGRRAIDLPEIRRLGCS